MQSDTPSVCNPNTEEVEFQRGKKGGGDTFYFLSVFILISSIFYNIGLMFYDFKCCNTKLLNTGRNIKTIEGNVWGRKQCSCTVLREQFGCQRSVTACG